ncbi:MAG: thiol reductant ABC exporter subunit CydC [Eggerthellaceae bacterium]|nr:thiol reductant ABC exporter subunit CydC [Eggerthellaceae bacterium]
MSVESPRGAVAGADARMPLWRRDSWVKPFFKQYRRALALALALGIATFVFAAALMFTSGYLISGAPLVVSVLVLNVPLGLVRLFGAGKPLLNYFERLASHDWVLRMTSLLRLRLYRSAEREALDPEAKRTTGDMLGLLAQDVGHIQNLYLRTLFPLIIGVVLYLALVMGTGILDVRLGLAMLVLAGLAAVTAPLVSVLANAARELRCKQLRSRLYDRLSDNVLGVGDWVLSQRSGDYLASHERAEALLREERRKVDRFSRVRDLALQAVFGATVVALLAWAGTRFGGLPDGGANWVAAFALGFFPLIEAFAPLSGAAQQAGSYRDSVQHLNDLPDPDAPRASSAVEPSRPLDIRIDSVFFRYAGVERDTLSGLSLDIPFGQKVAVLGRSGAGKSTLAALIRGDIRPQRGSVELGGAPCAAIGDGMARYLGVIQQRTYLFNATLLDNLRIGDPDATEQQARDALERVGLGPLLDRLPDGLGTMVDEAGLRFSGGERHRIALARVLLLGAPIVMLDEPFAALDPITEADLLRTLREVFADRTLILITHHLRGVADMDRVVFLADGKAAIDGEPAALERGNAYYRRLVKLDRGI